MRLKGYETVSVPVLAPGLVAEYTSTSGVIPLKNWNYKDAIVIINGEGGIALDKFLIVRYTHTKPKKGFFVYGAIKGISKGLRLVTLGTVEAVLKKGVVKQKKGSYSLLNYNVIYGML